MNTTNSYYLSQLQEQLEFLIEACQNALVRQIAHEIIITLQKQCGILLQYNPTLRYILKGDSKEKIIKPFMLALNDGDLSTRTATPKSGERGPGIIAPPGTAYVRLEIRNI